MINLEVKNLTVNLQDKQVLDDISWSIPNGKLTAVVGPNGAGKTTLLRSICNLQPARLGVVNLGGKPIGTIKQQELARTISWVPQHSTTPFDFSCLDTVLLGRYPWHLGYPQHRDRDLAMAALASVGLDGFAKRSVINLSSGEKQRLFIARALACDTPFLVLDEPCANLDIAVTLNLMSYLKTLGHAGKTLIITMHDLNLARRFADHIAVLAKGRMIAHGDGAAIIKPQIIDDVFGINSELVDVQSEQSYLILKNTKLPTMSPRIEIK